jgi:hypothetical protein
LGLRAITIFGCLRKTDWPNEIGARRPVAVTQLPAAIADAARFERERAQAIETEHAIVAA